MAVAPLLPPALGFTLGVVLDAHVSTGFRVPVVVLIVCTGVALLRGQPDMI